MSGRQAALRQHAALVRGFVGESWHLWLHDRCRLEVSVHESQLNDAALTVSERLPPEAAEWGQVLSTLCRPARAGSMVASVVFAEAVWSAHFELVDSGASLHPAAEPERHGRMVRALGSCVWRCAPELSRWLASASSDGRHQRDPSASGVRAPATHGAASGSCSTGHHIIATAPVVTPSSFAGDAGPGAGTQQVALIVASPMPGPDSCLQIKSGALHQHGSGTQRSAPQRGDQRLHVVLLSFVCSPGEKRAGTASALRPVVAVLPVERSPCSSGQERSGARIACCTAIELPHPSSTATGSAAAAGAAKEIRAPRLCIAVAFGSRVEVFGPADYASCGEASSAAPAPSLSVVATHEFPGDVTALTCAHLPLLHAGPLAVATGFLLAAATRPQTKLKLHAGAAAADLAELERRPVTVSSDKPVSALPPPSSTAGRGSPAHAGSSGWEAAAATHTVFPSGPVNMVIAAMRGAGEQGLSSSLSSPGSGLLESVRLLSAQGSQSIGHRDSERAVSLMLHSRADASAADSRGNRSGALAVAAGVTVPGSGMVDLTALLQARSNAAESAPSDGTATDGAASGALRDQTTPARDKPIATVKVEASGTAEVAHVVDGTEGGEAHAPIQLLAGSSGGVLQSLLTLSVTHPAVAAAAAGVDDAEAARLVGVKSGVGATPWLPRASLGADASASSACDVLQSPAVHLLCCDAADAPASQDGAAALRPLASHPLTEAGAGRPFSADALALCIASGSTDSGRHAPGDDAGTVTAYVVAARSGLPSSSRAAARADTSPGPLVCVALPLLTVAGSLQSLAAASTTRLTIVAADGPMATAALAGDAAFPAVTCCADAGGALEVRALEATRVPPPLGASAGAAHAPHPAAAARGQQAAAVTEASEAAAGQPFRSPFSPALQAAYRTTRPGGGLQSALQLPKGFATPATGLAAGPTGAEGDGVSLSRRVVLLRPAAAGGVAPPAVPDAGDFRQPLEPVCGAASTHAPPVAATSTEAHSRHRRAGAHVPATVPATPSANCGLLRARALAAAAAAQATAALALAALHEEVSGPYGAGDTRPDASAVDAICDSVAETLRHAAAAVARISP